MFSHLGNSPSFSADFTMLVSQGREEQVPFKKGRRGRHDIVAVHIKEESEVGTSSKAGKKKKNERSD